MTFVRRTRPLKASPAVQAAEIDDLQPVKPRNRRAIIDRATVQDRLTKTWLMASTPESARQAILELLKECLASGREEVRRRFDRGASGQEVARSLCFLSDQIVRVIYDHINDDLYPNPNPSMAERLSLVAVGGYGRGELAPFSDLDLLFLLPYKMSAHSEQVVEATLYFLWDLGFKVGHATRSLDDCLRQAAKDNTIATSLLEARYLWGDQALFIELRRRYRKEVQESGGAAFIEDKLAERTARHLRFGDGSRYSLEPNIKESKGGLRDLHTLFWIAKFVYRIDDVNQLVDKGVLAEQEVRAFRKAEKFLWTLRCNLHYQTDRAEERLTFDLQNQIAPLMGYKKHAGTKAVERFMKHYFLMAKEVGALTRILCAQLESEHNRRSRFRLPSLRIRRRIKGFKVEGDRLSVSGVTVFETNPVELLRIFSVAQEEELDIHPKALRWITQSLSLIGGKLRKNAQANALFLKMLTSEKNPATTLRRLNEAGVLGRFLPDFGRVVSQMQFNMYHHYTVDEHSIMAVEVLHAIEQGRLTEEAPIASEVVQEVLSRRVLYMAVLLHDVAKGRPGDHSQVGAQVADKLCRRLGLSAEETETVSWLVLNHLKMSDTAFRRDIDDGKTIKDLAEVIQSVERLRLLLVLTVADVRAVGPNIWSAWKAALLRELFWRTEEVLSGGFNTQGRERRVELAKLALAAELSDWPAEDMKAHLDRGYHSYWLSCDVQTQVRHAHLVREAEAQQRALTVDARIDRYREVVELTIYTPDHPGLVNRIAGALAVAGATVEGARIFTLSNGMALDIFYFHDAKNSSFDKPGKLENLTKAIEQSLSGDIAPLKELARQASIIPSRLEVFTVTPRVLIDNKASQNHTMVEINGRDRPGLLYRLTFAIAKQNFIIHAAKITTFGERAVDTFYIHDALGSKITSTSKLERLRAALLDALDRQIPKGQKKVPSRARTAKKPTQKKEEAAE
jgi:[protein-PII] uridylyltransferase|tara:strand:- start:1743 stop:4631 length:2889 start_codon:yes stop_codon:yes gene_type:complete